MEKERRTAHELDRPLYYIPSAEGKLNALENVTSREAAEDLTARFAEAVVDHAQRTPTGFTGNLMKR